MNKLLNNLSGNDEFPASFISSSSSSFIQFISYRRRHHYASPFNRSLILFTLLLIIINNVHSFSSPKILPFHFNPVQVQEGEKALASCYATSGDKPLIVKWLRNGEPLNEHNGLIKITNLDSISLLEFAAAQVKDQGNYTCELSNRIGKDSFTTELIVTAPPRWTLFSNDEIIAIGQQAILKCFADGSPKPTIHWLFSKNQQEDHTFQRLFQTDNLSFENDSSALIIQNSNKNNEGVYRCEASNQLGSSITREIRLKVEMPPKFDYAQGNLTIGLGTTTELRCDSSDQPRPTIVWNKIWPAQNSRTTFASSPIYPDGSQKTAQTKQYIGSGSRFMLTNVKASDAGLYECIAENTKTSLSTSQLFRVDIKLPARIVKKENSIVSVKRDETAKLECEVEGTQPVQVHWSKQLRNGLIVPLFDNDSKDDNSIHSDDSRITVMSRDFANRTIFELHLTVARQKDAAIYLCKASNEFGEDTSKTKLIIQDVPEPPERLEIDQVWSRSASLRWTPVTNLPNTPPIKHYLLQYWRDITNQQQSPSNTSSNDLSTENLQNNANLDVNYGSVYRLYEIEIPANQNQFILKTNLLPGTVYRLRLYSVNEFGKSHFSANQRLITEQEEPSLPPTDIRLHGKSKSTIKLSWRAPLRNSWNGQLTGYQVAFKMLKESEAAKIIDLHSASSVEQTFAFNTVRFTGQPIDDYYQEYTLTNLLKETLYCIMIRSLNKVGHGPYSQPIVVTTSNNDPPEAPAIYIDTVQKNSMVIKWTQNGNKDDLTHYILYYKDDKTVWLETMFPAKGKNSYTLNNLNEGTLYEIYMKASSHHGLSESSKVVRQITESSSKDTSGTLRSLQDSASKYFGQYTNIPPYLRSHVVIPVSIAIVLIVIICSVAIGYIKYEEKKTAIIQASLGIMASSPSKNFQYINSSVASPTANIQTNHLFNATMNQSNMQTMNSSTVSEEGYHSLKYTDFDKSNKPLLSARPPSAVQQQQQQQSLWLQRQSPIQEESESCSSTNPYATLPYDKLDDETDKKDKIFKSKPPPPHSDRPASMNLLTSAINIGNNMSKQMEQQQNALFDLSNLSNTTSFQPNYLLNSTVASGGSVTGQMQMDRKNQQIFADVHHRDDSDCYDFFQNL